MIQGQGEVAVITGAGRGFGAAIARRLAADGAAVALLARSGAEIEAVAASIAADGGRALAVPCDVADPAAVDAATQKVERSLGPVGLLVSNAGVAGPFGPLWQVDADAWWQAQAVHIRAPMLLMHRLLPGMVERGAGRVVCVSAIASRMVAAHLSAYCVGKIALNRLVAQAAAELAGTGVAVFAIDPGFVFTALAHGTMTAPDARRYLPAMVGRLEAAQARSEEPQVDLLRCAQRCADLFSGRYDALSGRYMELSDDLDAMLAGAAGAANPGGAA